MHRLLFWEFREQFPDFSWKTLPAWANVRDALIDDNVPGFGIRRTLMGGNLSFSLIAEILNRKAWKIFRHLIENDLEELEKAIPLEEIVCHVVSQFFDKEAIPVLEMLEEARPGIIAGFRDALGQNLLWYGMANPQSCRFHPNCQLTAFLIQHGCSPDHLTHIGLSWDFLTNSLSDKQKSHIWGKRWSANKLLSEEQPNIWERQRA